MKIALIGCSGHQGNAVSAAKANPDLRIVAAAPGGPEENMDKLVAGCPGKPRIYDDYRRMLDAEQPELVSVSPVYWRHQPVAVDCLRRGLHVLCEKPVAMNLEQLDELRAAHAASGRAFAGMHGMRYNPAFRAAHDAVKAGLIGRPVQISSQKSYAFKTDRPEFYRCRDTYGGTLCWVGIHAMDWTYWMLGPLRRLCALHTTLANRGYGECESSGVIAFELAAGGQGTITFDFLKPYSDTVARDACRIAGEDGVIDVQAGRAWITTHNEPVRELPAAPAELFFQAFADSASGRGTCLINAADTFEVTRLCLLARASADAGGQPQTILRSPQS